MVRASTTSRVRLLTVCGLLGSTSACGAESDTPETAWEPESTSTGMLEDDGTTTTTDGGSEGGSGTSTSGADPSGSTTTATDDASSSSSGADVTCAQVRVMIAPGAALNVRPDASTDAEPVGSLDNAVVVDVLEEVIGQAVEDDDTWLHVASADIDGYIARAHTSCAVDECDMFDVPDAAYLRSGLHPDASDALVYLGITTDRITQTIGDATASAGTHAQDGTAEGHAYSAATDLRVLGLSQAAIEQYLVDLAKAGYAGWYRQPGTDGVPSDWSPHIHAVWVGAPMKASLRNQMRSWMDGRNGLVSNTEYQFHQWPPCVRDELWQRYIAAGNSATD